MTDETMAKVIKAYENVVEALSNHTNTLKYSTDEREIAVVNTLLAAEQQLRPLLAEQTHPDDE